MKLKVLIEPSCLICPHMYSAYRKSPGFWLRSKQAPEDLDKGEILCFRTARLTLQRSGPAKGLECWEIQSYLRTGCGRSDSRERARWGWGGTGWMPECHWWMGCHREAFWPDQSGCTGFLWKWSLWSGVCILHLVWVTFCFGGRPRIMHILYSVMYGSQKEIWSDLILEASRRQESCYAKEWVIWTSWS